MKRILMITAASFTVVCAALPLAYTLIRVYADRHDANNRRRSEHTPLRMRASTIERVMPDE
jgi:hypothetical protein